MNFEFEPGKYLIFQISDFPKNVQSELISTLDVNGFIVNEPKFRDIVSRNVGSLPISPNSDLQTIITEGHLLNVYRDAEHSQIGLNFKHNAYKLSLEPFSQSHTASEDIHLFTILGVDHLNKNYAVGTEDSKGNYRYAGRVPFLQREKLYPGDKVKVKNKGTQICVQNIYALNDGKLTLVGRGISTLSRDPVIIASVPGTKDFSYSSVQIAIPKEAAESILEWSKKNIPDDILFENEDAHGREDYPHITVKYGLHDKTPDKAIELVKDAKAFDITLGEVSLFENDDKPYDVVKVEIESKDLHELNKKISDNLEVTDTYPGYKPHLTLAYVAKGKGAPYNGNTDFKGKKISINELEFSSKDKELGATQIALTANKEIRLWLDDDEENRLMPDDFNVWAKTSAEAIETIDKGGVVYISFDHDLGGEDTGYLVAKHIEEGAFHGTISRMGWNVHSGNPSGADNIRRAMISAERFWDQKKEAAFMPSLPGVPWGIADSPGSSYLPGAPLDTLHPVEQWNAFDSYSRIPAKRDPVKLLDMFKKRPLTDEELQEIRDLEVFPDQYEDLNKKLKPLSALTLKRTAGWYQGYELPEEEWVEKDNNEYEFNAKGAATNTRHLIDQLGEKDDPKLINIILKKVREQRQFTTEFAKHIPEMISKLVDNDRHLAALVHIAKLPHLSQKPFLGFDIVDLIHKLAASRPGRALDFLELFQDPEFIEDKQLSYFGAAGEQAVESLKKLDPKIAIQSLISKDNPGEAMSEIKRFKLQNEFNTQELTVSHVKQLVSEKDYEQALLMLDEYKIAAPKLRSQLTGVSTHSQIGSDEQAFQLLAKGSSRAKNKAIDWFVKNANLEALEKAFTDSDPNVRLEALKAVHILNEPAGFKLAAQGVEDPDNAVRKASLFSLLDIQSATDAITRDLSKTTESNLDLLNKFVNDGDREVRSVINYIVYDPKNNAPEELLEKVIKSNSDDELRGYGFRYFVSDPLNHPSGNIKEVILSRIGAKEWKEFFPWMDSRFSAGDPWFQWLPQEDPWYPKQDVTDVDAPGEESLPEERELALEVGPHKASLGKEAIQPPTAWQLGNPWGYAAALPTAPRDENLLLKDVRQFFGRPEGKWRDNLNEFWTALFKKKEPLSEKEADDPKLLTHDTPVDKTFESETKSVQLQEVRLAGETGNEQALLAAAHSLHDSVVIEAIAYATDQNFVDVVAEAYKSHNVDVRLRAVRAFDQLNSKDNLANAINNDPSFRVKAAALDALSTDKEVLNKVLTSDSPLLRARALHYLGKVKDIDALMKGLDDPSPEAAQQAAVWLHYYNEDTLLRQKEKSAPPELKKFIRKTLGDYNPLKETFDEIGTPEGKDRPKDKTDWVISVLQRFDWDKYYSNFSSPSKQAREGLDQIRDATDDKVIKNLINITFQTLTLNDSIQKLHGEWVKNSPKGGIEVDPDTGEMLLEEEQSELREQLKDAEGERIKAADKLHEQKSDFYNVIQKLGRNLKEFEKQYGEKLPGQAVDLMAIIDGYMNIYDLISAQEAHLRRTMFINVGDKHEM